MYNGVVRNYQLCTARYVKGYAPVRQELFKTLENRARHNKTRRAHMMSREGIRGSPRPCEGY